MGVFYPRRVMLVGDVFGDLVHGTGTVERNARDDVFHVLGTQLTHELFHARAFELEDRVRLARGDEFVDLGIFIAELGKIHVHAVIFEHILMRFSDVRERLQAQKVHFEHAQLFHFVLLILRGDVLAVLLQRNIIRDDFLTDNDARRVLRALPGHALYFERHVDDAVHLVRSVVYLHDFGRIMALDLFAVLAHVQFRMQNFSESDVGSVVDRLGGAVDQSQRHAVNARHVLDRALCLHRSEGEDLADLFAAVFANDVIYDLAAALIAEVHVEVGRGHALGVEEALEQQLIFERIDVGDTDGVSDDTAHAAAAPRAHGYALAFGVTDKVPNDEIIFGKARLDDYPQLVFRPFAYFVRDLAVTLFQPFIGELSQIIGRRGAVVRLEWRHKILARYVDVALVCYLRGRGDSLGDPGKELFHLLGRAQINLIGRKAHARGVVESLSRLNA